jgi:hypothetical protein
VEDARRLSSELGRQGWKATVVLEARLERGNRNRPALKRWYHNLPMAEPPRPLSSIETDTSIWTGLNGFGAVGPGPMIGKWGGVE